MNATDAELVRRVHSGELALHGLEGLLGSDAQGLQRAVAIRRQVLLDWLYQNEQTLHSVSHPSPRPLSLAGIPMLPFDYDSVLGRCCENVIGFVPVPLGFAGPLRLLAPFEPRPELSLPLPPFSDYYVPLATTEGALVASIARGCKALMHSAQFLTHSNSNPSSPCAIAGIRTLVYDDKMTRGPVLSLPGLDRVAALLTWLQSPIGWQTLSNAFQSTTRYGKLKNVRGTPSGCEVYVRFEASSGDAMGMNMLSKGVAASLAEIQRAFPDAQIVALSGNYCVDKKASSLNWTQGRGRSVIAEAYVADCVLERELRTSVAQLVSLNLKKNLKGSAMAGTSVGGFNAQAANIVAALFLATGQDLAQTIVSSNCMTWLEAVEEGRVLHMTVTMPSIEVGTVGGGTSLAAQSTCLSLLGIQGSCEAEPGQHARTLARLVAATVLAGELSLLASLAEGTLVKSHLALNRRSTHTHTS